MYVPSQVGVAMTYQNTRRFDNVTDDDLAPIREEFAQFEKYGFDPGWAHDLFDQYPTELAKLAAIKDEVTPDAFIGEQGPDMSLEADDIEEMMEDQIQAYKDYKWIAATELMEVSIEIMTRVANQMSQLTDAKLQALYEERDTLQDDFDTFEEFCTQIRQTAQAANMMSMLGGGGMLGDMLGGMCTYDEPPEVGETRIVEYAEPDVDVLGAIDLTEMEPVEGSADVKVAEAEIVGFEEPEDEIDKVMAHPPARVSIDGREFIVAPADVHGPDGTASGPSMMGLEGMLGDMQEMGGGDLGGLGGGDGDDPFGGMFDTSTDTDQFRVDDPDENEGDDDSTGIDFDKDDWR